MTCRRRSPGPRRHHCSSYHRDLVEGYQLARQAQLERAEAASIGYARELSDYWRTVEPPLLFREWLRGWRQQGET